MNTTTRLVNRNLIRAVIMAAAMILAALSPIAMPTDASAAAPAPHTVSTDTTTAGSISTYTCANGAPVFTCRVYFSFSGNQQVKLTYSYPGYTNNSYVSCFYPQGCTYVSPTVILSPSRSLTWTVQSLSGGTACIYYYEYTDTNSRQSAGSLPC